MPSLYNFGRLDRGGRDFYRNRDRDAGYRPDPNMPRELAVSESVVSANIGNLQWTATMKNYLAIFLGTPSSPKFAEFMAMEEGKRKKIEATGMKAWGDWMQKHQSVIAETGGPLGKTKRTSAQGVSDTKNNLSGYVVVKADSHDAAAKLFEKHPHFAIFPGDSVEIMEILPIPGQPQG